ncbi:MAG: PhzF family phenazine biosynthesis protein [Myxococcales bacterium]|nr:PhzF family phenazine biosynthesis protein [Myxococcales bacterium]
MREIALHQVDAFASRAFEGNPAAVCILDAWLPDSLMQAIAAENNLAETAFAVGQGAAYGLRWFTPQVEVALCGHATLATAHVLFNDLGVDAEELRFETQSGELRVSRAGEGRLRMDFPAVPNEPIPEPAGLAAALGASLLAVHRGRYLMCELESAATVARLAPDFGLLAKIPHNVMVTAAGEGPYDFVSRFFALPVGIAEDPVTGSAHCELAPFWAKRLGKTRLAARQLSARGGDVSCTLNGDRVELEGSAVTVLRGSLLLPD